MNKREKLAALLKDIEDLRTKSKAGSLTKEEADQFDTKVGEARSLKAEIDAEEKRTQDAADLDDMDKWLNEGRGSAARTQSRETVDQGKQKGEERKAKITSISERFLESDGWKRFKGDNFSRGDQSGAVGVRSFYHRETPDVSGLSAEELRTLVYTGAMPTTPPLIAPNRVPGIFTADMPEMNVRSAFLNLQTDSPAIEYFSENVFTNNAAFVAEATATGDSSGTKNESGLTFTSATVAVQTLAHWIPVNENTLEDVPQLQGTIEGRLVDGLKLVEDDAILTADGNSPNIRGLLNVSGVQDLDDTYFASNPVKGVGEDREDFDRITRARTQVRITGRARASFVFLSPADLERFITLTDGNNQYYSGSPFGDVALTSMRGLRVIETEALDEGTAVVGDGRMAAVFDRMQATVAAGWIDKQFVRNMITLRAEERIAFAVFRPAAFAVVELTSAT